MVNFTDDAFVDFVTLTKGIQNTPAGIPTSKNITGIEIRLSRVFIIDNKTPKIFPLPGYARLYFLVVVISDRGEVLQNLDLRSFPRVDDGEEIPIDKTIYYWKQKDAEDEPPSQLHTIVSIVKSKQGLRDTTQVLSQVKNTAEFNTVMNNIKAGLSSPMSDVSNLLFSVAGLVGKFLGDVDDKPLLTWMQSYTDINGDYDQLGKTTKRKKNKYAELDLSLIIRDKHREEAIAKLHNVELEDLS